MGYRSEVALKTTTEGYILMKQYMNKLPEEDRIIQYAEISKTPTGFYKIYFDWIKWYDSDDDVQNFINVLDLYEKQGIPYSFIRLGEDCYDIDWLHNYTDDHPDEIGDFEPIRSINDPDDDYEVIKRSCEKTGKDDEVEHDEDERLHIKSVVWEIFDRYTFDGHLVESDAKDILHDKLMIGLINDKEYKEALVH